MVIPVFAANEEVIPPEESTQTNLPVKPAVAAVAV